MVTDLAATVLGAELDQRLSGAGSCATVSALEVDTLAQQAGVDEAAVVLGCLAWARRWARAPISKFRVGAAARGRSGALYLGANLEFVDVALAETVHAEQAAIVNAWAAGETAITMIAASAAPCGLCRQFMLELPEPRPTISVPGAAPVELATLIPAHFGPGELGHAPTLLCSGPHGLRLEDDDPLVRLTLAAANRSSAPYTQSFSAVGLTTKEGTSVAAGVAESVAYNPTVGPMQAALITLHLRGGRIDSISDAVLIEVADALVRHRESAARVLAGISPMAGLRWFAASRP